MNEFLSRRRFIQHVAASQLSVGAAAAIAPALAWAQNLEAPPLLTDVTQALNVFELQAMAERTIRPAHYGYLQTGVLDDRTVEANRNSFSKWGIRARRLVDVSKVDLKVKLLGAEYASPITLAPVSAQRAFHHEGERPVALAAKARNSLFMLSTHISQVRR